MKNIRVKICGIRTIDQAVAALGAGADFIGLQFVPSSKRRVKQLVAEEICEKLKGKIKLVGVFQNQPLDEVNETAKDLNLDFAQLHGNEDSNFCKKVNVPVIKVFGLPAWFDVSGTTQEMEKYSVSYFLVDRETRGEGEMLSLENSRELAKHFELFFAGGINPENVFRIVKNVQPFAVDVASGIETDEIPDIEKIKLFVKNAKI